MDKKENKAHFLPGSRRKEEEDEISFVIYDGDRGYLFEFPGASSDRG